MTEACSKKQYIYVQVFNMHIYIFIMVNGLILVSLRVLKALFTTCHIHPISFSICSAF